MATRAECELSTERRARVLAEVWARNGELLRRQAARHAPDSSDAEDVLQSACVEFLRHYDGEPSEHALAYLMLAVKHSAWTARSRAWSRHRAALELTGTDAFEAATARHAPLCDRPGPADHALARAEASHLSLSRLKPDERTRSPCSRSATPTARSPPGRAGPEPR